MMGERFEWFGSSEGKILLAGAVLTFLGFAATFSMLLFNPDYYKMITGVAVAHLFFGRAAGLSVGFALEMSAPAAVMLNFTIELLMVLVIYPVFILSWNQLLNVGRFKSWLDQTRASAQKYHDKIEKYGMIGLFVFVWFPFWMTGPVVGAMIGYIMGLRHTFTLSIVLIGTFIATVCWAYLLSEIQAWMASIDPLAPWYFVGAIAGVVLLGYFIRRFRHD